MSWILRLFAMLFTAPLVFAAGTAQADDTVSGEAGAAIVHPLIVVNDGDLEFGAIIPNGTGVGRVRINARNGNRSANTNVTLVNSLGFGAASFAVSGRALTFVNLTSTATTITLTGPGDPMSVDRLRVSRNGGGQRTLPRRYRIPASGNMTIGFGGRLRVAGDQAPGNYSGQFDLVVAYE